MNTYMYIHIHQNIIALLQCDVIGVEGCNLMRFMFAQTHSDGLHDRSYTIFVIFIK